jgi:hypothetical protein
MPENLFFVSPYSGLRQSSRSPGDASLSTVTGMVPCYALRRSRNVRLSPKAADSEQENNYRCIFVCAGILIMENNTLRVGLAQIAPVWLDRQATRRR